MISAFTGEIFSGRRAVFARRWWQNGAMDRRLFVLGILAPAAAFADKYDFEARYVDPRTNRDKSCKLTLDKKKRQLRFRSGWKNADIQFDDITNAWVERRQNGKWYMTIQYRGPRASDEILVRMDRADIERDLARWEEYTGKPIRRERR